MKVKFYLACALAVAFSACQKKNLLPEDTTQQGSKDRLSTLADSDPFFDTGHPPDTSYHMAFTDRFLANNIDSNGEGWWSSRTGSATVNGAIGYNRAANLSVNNNNDGKLSIAFNQDPDGKYYGGGIISKKTFGYGYYEARVKLYTGSYGLHQSFWSFGPAIEIDGFEVDSKLRIESSVFHPGRHRWKPVETTHTNYYHSNSTEESLFVTVPNTNLSMPPATDDGIWNDADGVWYTVGYEWLPDRVNYYVNGVLRNVYGLQDSFGYNVNTFQPASVYLTALPYKVSSVLDMVTPQPGAKMQVEYFAYYTKKLTNINLLGNNQFEYVDNPSATKQEQYPSWIDNPLVVNGAKMYGNTTADNTNSYVINENGNWYLEQKNTAQAYKAETYQTLNYVLPGTYTFSCDLRCSGAGSKFIVLDKDKTTVLYSRMILGPHSDWIHISDNIPVTNNEVTILIYSDVAQGAWLNVDNVNFSLNP